MFSKTEIKRGLLGCFEISLFMREGIDRFADDKNAALRSFIWPLIFLPFVLFSFSYHSTGFSMPLLLSLHGVRMFVSFMLFLAVVYLVSKCYERQQHYLKFITVFNWLNIQSFIFALPILIALISHSYGVESYASYDALVGNYESYAVFMSLLGYVYCAFVLTHTFRIPWELGGFVAIVGMAIDQTALDVVVYLRDYLA